jgi:hypothetical protein
MSQTIRHLTFRSKGQLSHSPGSNFWLSPIPAPRGRIAPSVEHYVQAAKSLDHGVQDEILAAATPGEAKRLGRKVQLRPGWDERRFGVYRRALAAKFAPGTPLAAWLLATLPYAIAEGNTWGDRFWGQVREDGTWVGENWLGVLLMARRAELVAVDAIPAVRVGGHRFSDLMALAEALGVSEQPSLMPGCLEVDPPVEIEDEGPAPCTNAFCSWPTSRCRIDEEFVGVVDAADFYDPGDTDTCASMLAEQADG